MPVPPPRPDPNPQIDGLIRSIHARLRRRRAVRASAVGMWIGVALALVLVGTSRLWWPVALPAWSLAAALAVAGPLAGLLWGAAWPGLVRRDLALIADRAMGTEELFVTALHLRQSPAGWGREAVYARATRQLADLPPLRQAIPIRLPRHLRFLPLLVAAAIALLFLPQAVPPLPQAHARAPVEVEGERLEQRLDEIAAEFDVELPEQLDQELEQLVDDLKGDRLDQDEAVERLDELADQLDRYQQQLQPSMDVLEELEQAARDLSASQEASQLADALGGGDMEGASRAARGLADAMEQATPEERQRAGEAMERAGKQLAGSSDPQARQAGEALQRAGEQLQQSGMDDVRQQAGGHQQGGQPDRGQQEPCEGGDGEPGGECDGGGARQGRQGQQDAGRQGGQQGSGEQGGEESQFDGDGQGTGSDQLQSLADELSRSQELAERLQRDQAAMDQSQQLNGAMEGARQRLGGLPRVTSGQGSSDGQPGSTGDNQPGVALAGTGHTWEDQGTTQGYGSHQDADRSSDPRSEGEFADDFEQLYAPVRMAEAQSLMVGAEGELDDRGHVDFLPTRRVETGRDADAPLLVLPDAYQEGASQALQGERIPPGYRDAVKQYFDGME